jgi:hypothetical protein
MVFTLVVHSFSRILQYFSRNFPLVVHSKKILLLKVSEILKVRKFKIYENLNSEC